MAYIIKGKSLTIPPKEIHNPGIFFKQSTERSYLQPGEYLPSPAFQRKFNPKGVFLRVEVRIPY